MHLPVRAGADMRLLRAAVFTAVCVTLSAAGHTMAGGHGLPLRSLGVAWLMVFAVAAPLAGRERSLPAIAAGLTAGQLVLHVLFDVGQLCAPRTATRTITGSPDSVMDLAGRLLCNERLTPLTPWSAEHIVRAAGIDPATVDRHMRVHESATEAMTYSVPMLLGHLLAALATGWLMRRGEAALWRLAALSCGVLRTVFALVQVLVAGDCPDPRAALRPRRSAYYAGRPRTVRLRHTMARRGPPAYALAA